MSQRFLALKVRQTLTVLFPSAIRSLICACLMIVASVRAQEPVRLNTAIELALKNYPSIRQAQAQAEAARGEIELARADYLPRVDLLGQANRATINNITGLILPQAIVPAISGPPLAPSSSISNAWGSAAGALLSWEPFDFGRRRAATDVARAGARRADAEIEITRLDVAVAAADAFLGTVAAQQVVLAGRAAVERQQTFADAVRVLVRQGLRPGSDAARADAELSDARIALLQAQQIVEVRRAQLAEAVGVAGTPIATEAGALLDQVPPTDAPVAANLEEHPRVLAQRFQLATVQARQQLLGRSYFPRFNYQLGMSARGTGVTNDGRFEGGANGLLPITPNVATGMSVTFPVFDIFGLRSRRRIERSNAAAEQARLEKITQELKSQEAQAQALADGARRIAAEAPVKLTAARQADAASRARYKFGLAPITEVADAQRLLTEAEIGVAASRLALWQALLAIARARGAIEPFLQQVTNSQTSTVPNSGPKE